MKPTAFMTSGQVFTAIEGLSKEAKFVLCAMIMDNQWSDAMAAQELMDAGLIHLEGEGVDKRLVLGRPTQ